MLNSFLLTVATNDHAFYGLIGLSALFSILLVILILRRNRQKGKKIEIETDDDLDFVDRVMEDVRRDIEPTRTLDVPDYIEPEEASKEAEEPDKTEVKAAVSTSEATEEVAEKVTEPDKKAAVQVVPKPEPAPVVEKKIEPAPEPKSLEEGLKKTKNGFMSRLNGLFGQKKIDDELFEELEEILYSADIGQTATHLFERICEQAKTKDLKDAERLRDLLKEEIYTILKKAEVPFSLEGEPPKVILIVGVNGVGKTTTIGKLAKTFSESGKSVLLAAGDTFRAAAVEQLQIWSDRASVDMISAKEGANPSGVVYSAVEAAKARQVDVLITDTAGRLHTKYNLMEELKKIKSVVYKVLGREADEIWLVLDANTGQNAVSQAQKFHETLGLTGLILTKLDGTAKGGVVIGITEQLGLPIRYIGIGEAAGDLRPFDAREFVDALF